MLKKLMLAAVLGLPVTAFAGPYILIGGASGKADVEALEATFNPLAPLDSDDSFGRALVGAGADITPNLAVEALYLTKAEVSVSDRVTGEVGKLESSGIQLAALVKAPLTPSFAVFGKLSGNYMEVKYAYSDPLLPVNNMSMKDSSFYLGFGAGLEFLFNDDAGIRLTAERIQFRDTLNGNDSDLDQATIAVVLNF